MRAPATLALAALLAARAVRGDYVLQRSWPTSSNCDAGGSGAPTFSYADERYASFNKCQISSDNSFSYMYSCYNATWINADKWSSLTCTGALDPGYPSNGPLDVATPCVADPGGSGGSTQTSCIITAAPYTPPASEPNVALLFPQASPPCSGAPLYTASTSGAGALPACAALTPVFVTPVGQPFASVAYTTVCNASGAPTASGFSYFNLSSQCTGTKSATTAPVAFGTCVAVGTNLWWQ